MSNSDLMRWWCEDHPEKEMGHEGCNGAGVPDNARIHMLVHRRRLAEQELREAKRYYGMIFKQVIETIQLYKNCLKEQQNESNEKK